jgi:uncharacterized protein YqjF (DUF2071 family)
MSAGREWQLGVEGKPSPGRDVDCIILSMILVMAFGLHQQAERSLSYAVLATL